MSRGSPRALVVAAALVAGGLGAVIVVQPAWWTALVSGPTPIEHTVVRGDTLSKLARAHGTTVADLQEWNGLTSDRIDVGQVLVVGWTGDAPASPETVSPKTTSRRSSSASKRTAVAPSSKPVTAGSLTLPAEKACLSGPTLEGGGDELELAASQGLSRAQVSTAMRAFLPKLQRCIDDDWPEGTLRLSITVACTGRVKTVQVDDSGGLDAALVACATDTLRYAPFPAHDLPDGDTFGYPVVFSR